MPVVVLGKSQVRLYMERNFAQKTVKDKTIDTAVRNVLTLQDECGKDLYTKAYKGCIAATVANDKLSPETRKQRVVNFLRMVRAMKDAEFKRHFSADMSKGGVMAYIGNQITELNNAMRDSVTAVAKDDAIDEKYVPWTLIYNRAEAFVGSALTGDPKLIVRCKVLARVMILDHAPRRNLDYTALQFPREGETQDETRERALRGGLNVWHTDKLFINDYKTHNRYGEYVMQLTPQSAAYFQQLWDDDWDEDESVAGGGRGRGRHNYDRILGGLKIPDALRHILGFDATVNTLRHSFLTYYYSHKHGNPVYLHEKNAVALSMANSVNTHDRYIIRNTPYKDDQMQYYKNVVRARNKNISPQDRKIIKEYENATQQDSTVTAKTAPRRASPLVREVLEKYKGLFVGKTTEQKRTEKPFLFLSECDDVFRNGVRVKDILGSDVALIRKWASAMRG